MGTPRLRHRQLGRLAPLRRLHCEGHSFLPAIVAPALAIVATAAEGLLGVPLLLGVFPRAVAWASAVLLALFAGAMTLSFGIKAPLNYSVFADGAAALALSVWPKAGNSQTTR
jgi:uncharacterized membrane protein YphA (DoxX/SURF4 family)